MGISGDISLARERALRAREDAPRGSMIRNSSSSWSEVSTTRLRDASRLIRFGGGGFEAAAYPNAEFNVDTKSDASSWWSSGRERDSDLIRLREVSSGTIFGWLCERDPVVTGRLWERDLVVPGLLWERDLVEVGGLWILAWLLDVASVSSVNLSITRY